MYSKTVLYYTSNREDSDFEDKIKDNILKQKGDLPIVSVSQKPIDFGLNICVGDVGHSYLNLFRQVLIGAKACQTDYLVFAEADFLYPKEYFDFIPCGNNLYRYENVWLIFSDPRFHYKYYKKSYAGGALICKRTYIINELENYLKDQPQWIDGEFIVKDEHGKPKIDYSDIKKFPEEFIKVNSDIPCISFKTGNGMTTRASVNIEKTKNLPYWGEGGKLYLKMTNK